MLTRMPLPRPSMLPILLREICATRSLPREPEPDLVMDDPAQVEAYAEAGRIDGVMAAAYLFHSARVSQLIQGCKTVLDLGCGPATQLAQIAELNPDILFMGIDLSPEMLEAGEAHIQNLGLKNVQLRQGDITKLEGIDDQSVDGVISTMVLHHLPTFELLRACFEQIKRVLKQNGALYLTDFGRLKSLKSVIYFAYMNAAHQPHLFSLDYERSLRAAFLPEELKKMNESFFLGQAKFYTTFLLPILTLIKSPDKTIPASLQSRLVTMRKALPRKYRRDLDEIRQFFRMGGLRNDPFSK